MGFADGGVAVVSGCFHLLETLRVRDLLVALVPRGLRFRASEMPYNIFKTAMTGETGASS
jgi:hypothetical protein